GGIAYAWSGVTVIDTVATFENAPAASLALYWNVSGPEYPVAGVYRKLPFAFRRSVPCAGVTTTTAVRVSPASTSVSLARTPGAATVSAVPWFVEYASLLATGAWLPPLAVTVIVTVAAFDTAPTASRAW